MMPECAVERCLRGNQPRNSIRLRTPRDVGGLPSSPFSLHIFTCSSQSDRSITMNVGKCESCAKTVYDTEAIKVGGVSDPTVFHKVTLPPTLPSPSPTHQIVTRFFHHLFKHYIS